MNYEEVKKKLDAKLNRDEVSTRSNGQANLSYVGTHYVISKLNEILGQGNWSYEPMGVTNVFNGTVAQRGGDVFATSYIANVLLSGNIGGVLFSFADYGYGDGTDKTNPGKAHELAIKEAVTDGLKRCAKNLGPVMGLALYDKEQNDVEENAPEAPPQRVPATTSRVSPVSVTHVKKDTPLSVAGPEIESKPAIGANPKLLKSTLKSSVKVLISHNKMTVDSFKKDYAAGGKLIDAMTDDEVLSTYAKIKTQFTELNLQ